MSVNGLSPITLLKHLGINDPADIDIEAIAFYCGAEVKYRPLTGCAARIIGADDKAIITVDRESSWERQRFSIGHELGHWMKDRGKSAHLCNSEALNSVWDFGQDPEARANQYASDLLLPDYLFKPLASGQEVTLKTVKVLSNTFSTSLTATAIKLVSLGRPAMLVCYNMQRRLWFTRGPDVPQSIWPLDQLSHDSFAFDVLFGDKVQNRAQEVDADTWIKHRNAHRFTVMEDSVKISKDTVLSLIWWKNEDQLTELL